MKKNELLKSLKVLEIAYQRTMSKEQIELWEKMFSEWSGDRFNKSIEASICKCRYFPTIADIMMSGEPRIMEGF